MNKTGRFLQRHLKRALGSGDLNMCPVIIMWRTVPATSGNLAIENDSAPTGEDKEEPIPALVHYVGSNDTGADTTSRIKFGVAQRGDVIVDFMGDVDFSDKPNPRFRIGGVDYVQRSTGGTPAASFDVRCDGDPVFRTLCLMPLT